MSPTAKMELKAAAIGVGVILWLLAMYCAVFAQGIAALPPASAPLPPQKVRPRPTLTAIVPLELPPPPSWWSTEPKPVKTFSIEVPAGSMGTALPRPIRPPLVMPKLVPTFPVWGDQLPKDEELPR